MQHFYGELKGRGETLRTVTGTKKSGLEARLLTLDGRIIVNLWYDNSIKENKFDILIKVDNGALIQVASGILGDNHIEFRARNFNSKLGGFQK